MNNATLCELCVAIVSVVLLKNACLSADREHKVPYVPIAIGTRRTCGHSYYISGSYIRIINLY